MIPVVEGNSFLELLDYPQRLQNAGISMRFTPVRRIINCTDKRCTSRITSGKRPKLEPFFNPHHPAVLRAIKMTFEAGHRHGIWVGICGELGADTALTETFLRMGVDELSMNAKSVLPVRKIIRSIDLSKMCIRDRGKLRQRYLQFICL